MARYGEVPEFPETDDLADWLEFLWMDGGAGSDDPHLPYRPIRGVRLA